MNAPELEVVSDPTRLAIRAADLFVKTADAVVRERGRFTVALSGGSTPKRLYELLADPSTEAPWDKTHVFWTDERHVPPDHPDNNYKMVHEALLAKVPVPSVNIHRIKSELSDPAEAARDYQDGLITFFGLAANHVPNFDLILLGMGADAHTASIFPGQPELLETESLVESVWVEKLNAARISLTMRVINAGHSVVFLVSGVEKAAALSKVLEGPWDPVNRPAQAVNPNSGKLKWIIDEAAASLLSDVKRLQRSNSL